MFLVINVYPFPLFQVGVKPKLTDRVHNLTKRDFQKYLSKDNNVCRGSTLKAITDNIINQANKQSYSISSIFNLFESNNEFFSAFFFCLFG